MAALDAAVRLRQRERLERQAVVHDERMVLERRRRALGLGAVELAALVLGAFEEDRGDRGGGGPAVVLRVVVEDIAELARLRQQLT